MKKILARFNPEQLRETFLVLLILVFVLFFSTQIPDYFNPRFINRISTSVAVVGILAVGQTLVFLTRNFDLSIGSIMGVSAYLIGQQLWHHPGIPPILAVVLAIGFGMLMGAINGVLVAYGKVPSIVTTIGTLAIYRSFLVEYSHAVPITTNLLPDWIVNLNKVVLFSFHGFEFRVLFGILLLVAIIFYLILSYHRFGRLLYATGSNPSASRIAGFPDRRIVFMAFLISGGLAGLAGFMYLVRFGNITVLSGIGFEFSSIAAVVVGGVSNMGGSGTIIGAFLGSLFINILQNSLYRSLVVSEFWRDAILGLMILLSVAIDHIVIGHLRKNWARAGFHLKSEETSNVK